MTETDGKVAPDFLFSRIKNVHFSGGPWMAIYGIANAGANSLGFQTDATITFDFPGMAGGTRGFTIIRGDQPITSLRAPHAITAKDLQGKLRTDAGLGLTGFSIGAQSSGQGIVQPEAAYFIDLAKFPKTKFPVRGTATNNNIETIISQCAVLLYKKAPKIGTVIGNGKILEPLPRDDAEYFSKVGNSAPGSLTTDFIVDPVNITVTGKP